jgi:hypothetical protein
MPNSIEQLFIQKKDALLGHYKAIVEEYPERKGEIDSHLTEEMQK